MSEEILMNVTPEETRVGLIENGVVQEVCIERNNHRGLVGNIYNGHVCRVLPGMQAAFVEVGLERSAFIHVSDIYQPSEKPAKEDIRCLLQEGQNIVVQVVKDMLGTKGARLTTYISIPSRFLVLTPYSSNIGISQRIENEEERDRLRNTINELREANPVMRDSKLGFIVRTVAEHTQKDELELDMEFLCKLWTSIAEKSNTTSKQIIHEDLPLMIRSLRDMMNKNVERVRIDSYHSHMSAKQFSEKYIPQLSNRIEFYDKDQPIFDLYSTEDEIRLALERKVELKSGGYLIIDQTEAMTTIDINTGAFVGHRNLEETIFKTNLEATQSIARQLKLRNLGGIIIIDFIDMEHEEHKRQVLATFEKCLEKDHAKTYVSAVSSLGLVEMTRKRTRESLEHILCETCPTCRGRGSLKTAETVCYEIFRELQRESRQYKVDSFLLIASEIVMNLMREEESDNLAELVEIIGAPVRLQVEPLYTQEQFDIVLM
jgi:ribonuclease G